LKLLALPDQPLDIAAVAAALGELACRFDLDIVAECDSTNARLLERAELGAPSGSVLVALRQTAGRGRRGRSWISMPGDSLTFSLLWRFPPEMALDGLSLAVGVAVAQALEGLGIPGVALKWPNDVLLGVERRKLAGVLLELVPGPRPVAVVIGIGVNLRLPSGMPAELQRTAAALVESGLSLLSTSVLLARMLGALSATLARFSDAGFAGLRGEWLIRHAYQGRAVRLLSDFADPLDGRCLGVDTDGALLLETAAGTQRIISGEVSLRAASTEKEGEGAP